MTTYALQSPGHPGAELTFNTPASGDLAPCGAKTALMVVNPTGNGNVTVSLPMPASDGVSVGPRVVTCPAGSSAPTWIPLPTSVYGEGPISLTYTGTLATVEVAVVTIPG